MTVSSTPLSTTLTCNGSVVAFPFSFGVGAAADIKVILTDPDGNDTVLEVTTHYSVAFPEKDWDSGGTPIEWDYSSGGIVTTVATYDADYQITICTDIAITQETNFTQGMASLYHVIENALDKLTRICKQLEIRLIAVEVSVAAGEPVTPNMITYLGRLTTDPDTAGWGDSEKFTVWFNTTDNRARYWSGSEILMF